MEPTAAYSYFLNGLQSEVLLIGGIEIDAPNSRVMFTSPQIHVRADFRLAYKQNMQFVATKSSSPSTAETRSGPRELEQSAVP